MPAAISFRIPTKTANKYDFSNYLKKMCALIVLTGWNSKMNHTSHNDSEKKPSQEKLLN